MISVRYDHDTLDESVKTPRHKIGKQLNRVHVILSFPQGWSPLVHSHSETLMPRKCDGTANVAILYLRQAHVFV